MLARAKQIARLRRVALGEVVSELMRRGLELHVDEREGFPVFRVPRGARRITAEAVKQAEDEW